MLFASCAVAVPAQAQRLESVGNTYTPTNLNGSAVITWPATAPWDAVPEGTHAILDATTKVPGAGLTTLTYGTTREMFGLSQTSGRIVIEENGDISEHVSSVVGGSISPETGEVKLQATS